MHTYLQTKYVRKRKRKSFFMLVCIWIEAWVYIPHSTKVEIGADSEHMLFEIVRDNKDSKRTTFPKKKNRGKNKTF